MANLKFSIIIPAFNEQETIAKTIFDLKDYLHLNFFDSAEIIVVNDGSTDVTKEIISKIEGIKAINHPYNKGYGASIKSGAAASEMDWILSFDADGQHRAEDIKRLVEASQGYDMVVGARQTYKGPLVRQPGKKLLYWVAEYLVEQKIPDLNSGLRLVKKDLYLKYKHLLPNGFSWTTTITLAFFKDCLSIRYVPIEVNKRQGGKSMVKLSDAGKTLMLILRIVMLFSPLRIFLPMTLVLGALSFIEIIISIITLNVSKSAVLLIISTILIFFFGLLADQIAAIRREMK